MWRNSKSTVDLELPSLHEIIHTLDFTQVENFLYRKHKSELTNLMNELIQRKERDQQVTGLSPP